MLAWSRSGTLWRHSRGVDADRSKTSCKGTERWQSPTCIIRSSGMSQAVQAIADSPSIESLTLELSHADKLPLLSKLMNLKYLSIMTDYSKDLYKCGPTSAVLDLLENSSNMTQLEVSRLHLNPGRLYKLLKRNTTLESINS